jgi:endonuclease III
MNKSGPNLDALNKIIKRLIKPAPGGHAPKQEPLPRLVRAFLEFDCDSNRLLAAEARIMSSVVDFNELRVTPAIELAAALGVRYPFAESRCAMLHRTLQSIFDREHQMSLDGLHGMKKADIRKYLQTLAGMNAYVEAVVALECFDVAAAPVDTKLQLWLISKECFPAEASIPEVQHVLEKHIRAGDMLKFYHAVRREIDEWVPRVWPKPAKIPSPMLAPPAVNASTTTPTPKAAPETPQEHRTPAAKAAPAKTSAGHPKPAAKAKQRAGKGK